MVYHHGMPVAVCPVAEQERDWVSLACGPLRFERDTFLILYLSADGDPLKHGVQAAGRVAACTGSHVNVRLQEVPEEPE
jgi:hypothetical protein